MSDDTSNQERARAIAADAFRPVSPTPVQRFAFGRLEVRQEEQEAIDAYRKDIEERAKQYFSRKASD